MADMAIDTARQLKQILTGKRDGEKYKVRLFRDNAEVLESIVSSKQVEKKYEIKFDHFETVYRRTEGRIH